MTGELMQTASKTLHPPVYQSSSEKQSSYILRFAASPLPTNTNQGKVTVQSK